MEWKPIETAPKTTADEVVYILIGDGVCLPDIVTWKPRRAEYINVFGMRHLARPAGWFSVNGSRSRLCGKATVWTHIPAY